MEMNVLMIAGHEGAEVHKAGSRERESQTCDDIKFSSSKLSISLL